MIWWTLILIWFLGDITFSNHELQQDWNQYWPQGSNCSIWPRLCSVLPWRCRLHLDNFDRGHSGSCCYLLWLNLETGDRVETTVPLIMIQEWSIAMQPDCDSRSQSNDGGKWFIRFLRCSDGFSGYHRCSSWFELKAAWIPISLGCAEDPHRLYASSFRLRWRTLHYCISLFVCQETYWGFPGRPLSIYYNSLFI